MVSGAGEESSREKKGGRTVKGGEKGRGRKGGTDLGFSFNVLFY